MAENDQAQAAQQQAGQQFGVQRVYIKDLSFETPMGFEVFTKQWQPQIKVDLNTRSSKAADDIHEVVLTITITAKLEEQTAFLVEVQQAGLFLVRGIEGEQLQQVLGIMCPNILFPYAREAIDNLANRGSFPALMLQPVNFEALYRQVQEQQAQQQPAN